MCYECVTWCAIRGRIIATSLGLVTCEEREGMLSVGVCYVGVL